MYLSRLILNPRSRAVWRDLADCQELHRTVMSAFPDSVDGPSGRVRFSVLHRVDADPRTGRPVLYVQSRIEPDWSRLPIGYLADPGPAEENPACKSIDRALETLAAGMVLRFRLRANPTRKIDTKSGPDGERRHGRRVELRSEVDQIGWLERKGRDAGFTVESVRRVPDVPDVIVTARSKIGFTGGYRRRPVPGAGDGRDRLTFASVVMEGHLRVTDADKFRQAVINGIGPAKAYGFGLLSIARAGR